MGTFLYIAFEMTMSLVRQWWQRQALWTLSSRQAWSSEWVPAQPALPKQGLGEQIKRTDGSVVVFAPPQPPLVTTYKSMQQQLPPRVVQLKVSDGFLCSAVLHMAPGLTCLSMAHKLVPPQYWSCTVRPQLSESWVDSVVMLDKVVHNSQWDLCYRMVGI